MKLNNLINDDDDLHDDINDEDDDDEDDEEEEEREPGRVRCQQPGEGVVELVHIGRNQDGTVVARAARSTLMRLRPGAD